MKYHQGRFKPKNPKKYRGDVNNIIFRSSWELACLKWLDTNKDILSYSSEEIIINYFYEADKKYHRYFPDLLFSTKDRTFLIEIKPKKELSPPLYNGRKTKRYISESLTYIKNENKWKAAKKYAENKGWQFEIWTEDILKKMGILKRGLPKLQKLKPLSKV